MEQRGTAGTGATGGARLRQVLIDHALVMYFKDRSMTKLDDQ